MASHRHSLAEAQAILVEFRDCSVDSLLALFRKAEVPGFEDLRGDTVGGFLARDPTAPAWRMSLANLAFGKQLVGWKGKRFVTPFGAGRNGRGVNLFASRVLPERFGFNTIIAPALDDERPCLRLDYDPFPSPVCGTMDELRTLSDGVFLGMGYHRFPWERRYKFLTFFMLCSLPAPEAPESIAEVSQWAPTTMGVR